MYSFLYDNEFCSNQSHKSLASLSLITLNLKYYITSKVFNHPNKEEYSRHKSIASKKMWENESYRENFIKLTTGRANFFTEVHRVPSV